MTAAINMQGVPTPFMWLPQTGVNLFTIEDEAGQTLQDEAGRDLERDAPYVPPLP